MSVDFFKVPEMRRSADRHHGTLLHADAVEARYIGRVCIRNLNHTAGAGDGLQVLPDNGRVEIGGHLDRVNGVGLSVELELKAIGGRHGK
jgi:hypothetical protein